MRPVTWRALPAYPAWCRSMRHSCTVASNSFYRTLLSILLHNVFCFLPIPSAQSLHVLHIPFANNVFNINPSRNDKSGSNNALNGTSQSTHTPPPLPGYTTILPKPIHSTMLLPRRPDPSLRRHPLQLLCHPIFMLRTRLLVPRQRPLHAIRPGQPRQLHG